MSTAVSRDDILRALSTIQDPDLHRDIVSLGFVQDLKIEDGHVRFSIVLTTPACPVRDQMKAAAERVVRGLPGVRDVTVEMRANTAMGRMPQGPQEKLLAGVRHIVAVASVKGGVGKTTTSVNLALALTETGARVGLLDADIHGPNVPLMMGIKQPPMMRGDEEGKILPVSAYGVKVISIGFFIGQDNQAVIWRGPMVHSAIHQFLRDVKWGELDYLVVDLPPGTGDAPLSLCQTVPLSGVVIVTTPQDVALQDVVKGIAMFRRLEVPIVGIVENMAYFVCPGCGQRTEIFGTGGGRLLAEQTELPFLGEIPLHPSVREGGDTGRPIVIAAADSPQAEAFRKVAGAVAARLSVLAYQRAEAAPGKPRGVPIRFFGR
ncbi:MAG TPA: Mrp/NBP35 family ATP-binding protein [Chloroflexota bacterium]|nr:Mrp/NBP35 family ATP-binding protein [Chloroflexota bacterium]